MHDEEQRRRLLQPTGWAGRSIIVVLLLLLSGCGQATAQTVGEDGPLLFVARMSFLPPSGNDADIEGELAVRSNCVGLVTGADDSFTPVVWPRGVQATGGERTTLEMPSGERVVEGDTILGAGGERPVAEVGVDVPDECVGESGAMIVFNRDSELDVESQN